MKPREHDNTMKNWWYAARFPQRSRFKEPLANALLRLLRTILLHQPYATVNVVGDVAGTGQRLIAAVVRRTESNIL